MNYESLQNKPSNFRALTGYSPEMFNALLPHFSAAWKSYISVHTIMGEKRKRPVLNERKNSQFPKDGDKLFFILFFLKNNVTQQVLAAQFDLAQPHVSTWITLLNKILKQALEKAGVLPEQRAEKINKAIGDNQDILIDGAERPIERSLDDENQKEDYSGKKKTLRQKFDYR